MDKESSAIYMRLLPEDMMRCSKCILQIIPMDMIVDIRYNKINMILDGIDNQDEDYYEAYDIADWISWLSPYV